MATTDADSAWVRERLAVLDVPREWEPDGPAARQRLEIARQRSASSSRAWTWRLATAAAVMIMIGAIPAVQVAAQRAWDILFAREVSVLRIDLDNLPREISEALLSPGLIGGVSGHSVASLTDASAQAGFTVRSASSDLLPGTPEMTLVSPLTAELVLRVDALERAARRANVTDRAVRPEWAGVPIRLSTGALVIATYPSNGATLLQTTPIGITVPAAFDFPGFVEFALRLVGFQPPEAAALAARTAVGPMAFLGIPRSDRVRVEEVVVRSGIATLIHDLDEKDPAERVTLIWSGADRLYVLSGPMTDDVAIAIANGLN